MRVHTVTKNKRVGDRAMTSRSGWRIHVWRLLAWVVLVPVLGLAAAPSAGAAPVEVQALLPAGFGAAVAPSDGLVFGARVSSLARAQPACERTETIVQTNGEDKGAGSVQGNTLPVIADGYRYDMVICVVGHQTPRYHQVCETFYDPETGGEKTECTTEQVTTQVCVWQWDANEQRDVQVCHEEPVFDVSETRSYLSHTTVLHLDAHEWITHAVNDALNNAQSGPLKEGVWWNSTPGYNSRQIHGLETWFSVSAVDPGPGATTGLFPDDFLNEDGTDHEIEVSIELTPEYAVWDFEDGAMTCKAFGDLWTSGTGADAEAPCGRHWPVTSAAESDDLESVELNSVQITYSFKITSTNNWEAVAKAERDDYLQTVNGVLPAPPVNDDGTFDLDNDELADARVSSKPGASRDFYVGEVQAYGTTGIDVNESAPPPESPWVQPDKSTCEKVGGIFGFASGLVTWTCKLVGAVVGTYLAFANAVWDGIQFVAAIVQVIAQGLWDLIKGCFSMVTDLIADVGDTVKTVKDFIADPSGQAQEMLNNISLIKEQLLNPETRMDFVYNVLGELGDEFLHLDILEEQGVVAWIGRVVCEVVGAFLGKKIADLLKGSKLAQKIEAWLDGKLPDISPCALKRLSRAADIASGLYDAYEIASAAAAAGNSFPTGTPVLLADRTHRPIEDIEPGDWVLSYDFVQQHWEPQLVVDQWSAIDRGQMATLTLSNGSQVEATDGHRFWVNSLGEWTELEDVKAGDVLLTPDGVTTVSSVREFAPADTLVWELTIAENQNFAVSTGTTDLLVHNACSGSSGTSGGDGSNPDANGSLEVDADGNVDFTDPSGNIFDNVMLDADGKPVIIISDNFTVVVHNDGSVSFVDADGNVTPGFLDPSTGISLPQTDGSIDYLGTDGTLHSDVHTGADGSVYVDTGNTPIPANVVNPTPTQLSGAAEHGVDARWIDPDTGAIRWVPAPGVSGPEVRSELGSGDRVDRFGSDPDRPQGGYLSPEGTPFGERAIPGSNDTYFPFEVRTDRPGLPVHEGTIAPWFDQPGGGTQYRLDSQLVTDMYGPEGTNPNVDYPDMLGDDGRVSYAYWFQPVTGE